MLIIYFVIGLLWLLGTILGCYLLCIAFASWLASKEDTGAYKGMYVEHEGTYMSLKHYYDNFVDKV